MHSEAEFLGTGIGMALAHKIIHRPGGTIWEEGDLIKPPPSITSKKFKD